MFEEKRRGVGSSVRTYNALNRVTTDAVNKLSYYEYDGNDRLTLTRNRNNHTTTYEYDSMGRLVEEINPINHNEDKGTVHPS